MKELHPGPAPLEMPEANPVTFPALGNTSISLEPSAPTVRSAGRSSLDNLRLLYEGIRSPRPVRLWADSVPAAG